MLESVQRYGRRVKVFVGNGRPPQHLGVTLMHAPQPIVGRAAIVKRSFLRELAVFDHFLEIVRHIRAEIATAQRQLAGGRLGIANIEQYRPLCIVDVVNTESIQIELNHFKETAGEVVRLAK